MAIGLVLLGNSCHRQAAPMHRPSLVGLKLPLLREGAGLAIAGAIDGRDARLELDPGRVLSLISPGCFETPPSYGATVQVEELDRRTKPLPMVMVSGLSIRQLSIPPFEAGMRGGSNRCALALGDDVLGPYALDLNLQEGTVTFLASGSLKESPVRVALSRTLTFDWPLLPVHFVQGSRELVVPVLFSLRAHRTTLFASVADASAFQNDGTQVPLSQIAVSSELRRGPAMAAVVMRTNPGPAGGVLGLDFWGRSHFVVDLGTRSIAVLVTDLGEPDHSAQQLLDELQRNPQPDAEDPPEPRDPPN